MSDVILHLLEEEKKAAALLANAQIEAEKRILLAHTKETEQYKKNFDQLVEKFEDMYAKESTVIVGNYNASMEQYRAQLNGIPVDSAAFNALLEKLLQRA
jgi:hypothetical protein